ncbi:MAG TPA: class I SAM-dependent methyltransferase [Bryobacteraceae bacterium]|nr:class I SAM-dependent methyltransferase [Bryobacteraceae bacterium]
MTGPRRMVRRLREKLRAAYAVYQSDPERLRPGTRLYEKRTREETQHYSGVYSTGEAEAHLLEPAPAAWEEIQRRSAALLRRATGMDLTEHIVSRLTTRPEARFLSLGSGAGGVEMVFAREAPGTQFLCLDLNQELLRVGRDAARNEGLNMRFEPADLNTVNLPRAEFDLVFCHASLHHVLELERLAEQVKQALRPGGEWIVVDIITRSGYRMWPETRKVVRPLFRTLPAQFRLNHTAYLPERRIDREIWEGDTRAAGMECIRSGDILPVLRSRFRQVAFAGYQSIARRFLDTMYGPNYDLSQPLDARLLDWIWELDCHYVASGALRPESFFGVYAP